MNECKKTGSSNPGFFQSPQKSGHPAWDGSDQTYPFILSAGVINRKNKACQGKINGKNHEKMNVPASTLDTLTPGAAGNCTRCDESIPRPRQGCVRNAIQGLPLRFID